jgi:hypothetical protein
MMKMANEVIHSRIRKARAVIAAGVRLSQPALERQGREEYALSSVENAILLYSDNLTAEARAFLAHLLFDSPTEPTTATDADEDPTADAEETAAELKQLRQAKTPFDLVPPSELPPETLYDPDDEEEWEEEDPLV